MEERHNCWMCIPPDTGGHLYVNTVKNKYHCKKCDARGMWDKDTFPAEAWVKEAVDYSYVDLFPFRADAPAGGEKQWAYGTKRLPPKIVGARCYWSQYIPNRIFFPVFNSGRITVWQGRSIDGSEPKYLNHGATSSYLYNLDYVTDRWCVLCEGPIDALSAPNGVALFGKSISRIQSMLLTASFDKIYWGLDGDTTGQKKVQEQKEVLKQYVEVIDIPMGTSEDPASVGYAEMERRIWAL